MTGRSHFSQTGMRGGWPIGVMLCIRNCRASASLATREGLATGQAAIANHEAVNSMEQ